MRPELERRAGRSLGSFEARTLALFALLVVGTVAIFAVASFVWVNRGLGAIRHQGEETRKVVLENREALSALLCSVSLTGHANLEGLRALAHEFGVDLGPIPGEPVVCKIPGDDVFIGSAGNDTLGGTSGRDFMVGGDGNDELRGHGGGDTEFGQGGNDDLWADGGQDTLRGGDGNDDLHATADDRVRDTLDGGPGHDKCYLRRNDRAVGCEQVFRQ